MTPTMALIGFVALAILLMRPLLAASGEMSPRQRRKTQLLSRPIDLAQIFPSTRDEHHS